MRWCTKIDKYHVCCNDIISMYYTTNATNDTDSANAPLNLNEILYFTTNVLIKYHDITFLCVKNV